MAKVLENLTEEECYLFSILEDRSGLDLAEFTWVDQDTEDGCFRCWPFQWRWFRDESSQQIDQAARAVGKSLSIKMRAFVFPFLFPGKEMVVTAPEGVHVDAITDLIETQFYTTRLGREMLTGGRFGVKHKPFHMNFANGARIMGRLPQITGKGVKGIHPIWLELDEAQDYPPAGWTELIETLNRNSGKKDGVWRAHGVTRGIRDRFYDLTDTTNPDNRWRVHRITAMHRPGWDDEERQDKIAMYNGSKDDPDYRRNVLGLHGDATNPIFVLHRLMKCVDDDTGSDYNVDEYTQIKLSDMQVAEDDILTYLNFPSRHINDYTVNGKRARYWCGMDIGFTRDPSEILIFVEHSPTEKWNKEKQKMVAIPKERRSSRLKLLTRITLRRIKIHDQAATIKEVIRFYRPETFAMDKAGNGLGLYQMVMEDPEIASRIKGYNHSAKEIVEIDEAVEVDPRTGEVVKEALMKRNMLEYCVDEATEVLTNRGWLRQWELSTSDLVYTLNPLSDLGEWQKPLAIHRFLGSREVEELAARGFSSVTTLDHRWLVDRYCPYVKSDKREWRTTQNLVAACRIPRTRPQAEWPNPKFSDDLVEIVAWAWTEGSIQRERLTIGQSLRVNPTKVARIESALRRQFGPPSQRYERGGWTFRDRDGMREFGISKIQSAVVLAHLGENKAVKSDFLMGLTRAQMQLFIDVSIMADGSEHGGRRQLAQSDQGRIRSFEMACALAGIPTSTVHDAAGRWACSLLKRSSSSPIQGRGVGIWSRERRLHQGVVWCPEVQNGTWLARRDGTVYFTGNSTDKLRELVDSERIHLPWDKNLVGQFQGATETARQRGQDAYGRNKTFSSGEDHALDACRQAAMAFTQETIDELLREDKFEPVMDAFIGAW